MKKNIYILLTIVITMAVSGCNPYNNAGEGAGVGGALGAVAGGIIGHQTHDTAAGMLIGGAVGALGGAAVGSQMKKEPEYVEPATVVVAQPPSEIQSADAVTVNVPNSNGSYTAVVLRRSGNGFVGPQGEFYPQVPSVNQLKVMYGK